ncbi:hypothetical protein QN345_00490 [Cryobacterium sp. 10I1]|uniref:hypothetical protein n=1 Tax=Cryobacterium sp. 10I1 TaxID=3048578 RepID=UPI002B2265BB|nr:hypothetical protein [Cryobacterium sp. 10I1]MEB0303817.1 hypothetical protein [Cryobacterium sp. 10I1]
MPKFRNVSPQGGDLDTPLAGRVVKHGEVIDLPPARAIFFVGQDETWEPVDDETRAFVAEVTAAQEPQEPSTTDAPQAGADTNGEPA